MACLLPLLLVLDCATRMDLLQIPRERIKPASRSRDGWRRTRRERERERGTNSPPDYRLTRQISLIRLHLRINFAPLSAWSNCSAVIEVLFARSAQAEQMVHSFEFAQIIIVAEEGTKDLHNN